MRKIRAIQILKNNLATIFLLVFYISEAFSKYSIFFSGGKSDIPRVIKLVVLIFLVLAIVKPIKNLLFPIFLAAIFCIGQFFLEDAFNTEIVVSFGKFLFPIFLFLYFNKYNPDTLSVKVIFKTFEIILYANSILILIGLCFDVHLFQSYKWTRFGYNGLFITSATSSYIYTIALFYFLLKYKNEFFYKWNVILIILSSLLIGTKLMYFSVIGSGLIYLLFYVHLSSLYRKYFLVAFLFIIIICFYFFFFQWGTFNEIRKEAGLLSSILSYRNDLFLEETIPFIDKNWRFSNYLFGGISNLNLRSQLGFVDVFLFWGLLGGVLYLYAFYKNFVTFYLNKSYFYFILFLSIIVFLAGNFFENASVAIYLIVLREKFLEEQSKSNYKMNE